MSNIRYQLVVSFLSLLLLSCQAEKTVVQAPPSGFELFQQKCSKCHGLDRALQATKSKDAWMATINRMRDEHQVDISGQDIELLVRYHAGRQQQEAALFKEKCQVCHPGKVFLENNFTPQQTREIIRRMQEKAGNIITDDDVELIVNYHKREHRQALQNNLRAAFGLQPQKDNSMNMAAIVLFMDKCSQCHVVDIALSVLKDERVWKKTIKQMQVYSRGRITDKDAEELVGFHVSRQKLEIDTFQKTCTSCHDDERILSRSMNSEEWTATIKRMQQKAPQLITDEKITILASYHHRREMVLASIFLGNCGMCHTISDTFDTTVSPSAIGTLVLLAEEKFTDDVTPPDVQSLLKLHSQKEQREMQLFEGRCTMCHAEEETDQSIKKMKRSREEWTLFIASLEEQVYNDDVATAIETQINYHVVKKRGNK